MTHRSRLVCLLSALSVVLVSQAHSASAGPKIAPLRIVSFNTAMGLGIKLFSQRSVASFFEQEPALSRAHVFSLQEVCLNDRRQLAPYLRLMLRTYKVQYHYTDYASTNLAEKCDKGQAIVSAFPILAAGTLQLETVGAARSAIWVDLAVKRPGYERIRVYDLHLSNREHKNFVPVLRRAEQADQVLDHALAFSRQHPEVPVILSGDFNAMGTLSEPSDRELVVQRFQQHFQASQASYAATFMVPYQLDWIFYAGLTLASSASVPWVFSDHFPVVADFRL